VAVRIITDNDKAFDRGSDVERLARSGIDVCVDRTSHHMHHKFAIFDRKRLLTGSYNWTRSAASSNEENFIIVDNPRLRSSFQDEFDRLWKEFSTW
jgi:phosphatidylserine/phosphatidylglycerophosphate/cardiolipin synthase-like enzyme